MTPNPEIKNSNSEKFSVKGSDSVHTNNDRANIK